VSAVTNVWNQIFNNQPDNFPDTWEKLFHAEGAKGPPLDDQQCDGARAIYGSDHPLVRHHCKPKFKIVVR